MRSIVLALALMLAGSCAHAQAQGGAAAHAVAQVMIAALAPAGQAASGYAWDALTARVSPPVRWHGQGFEAAGPEPGSGVMRNGWLEGRQFGVSAQGAETHVRHFSIDVDDALATEALLENLRAEGAEVSFAGDDESAMFYYVTVPGREAAQLEARRVCTPYGSRAAQHCRSVMTWNFEPL